MKTLETIFGLIKIPLDFILTLAAFFAAYNLREVTDLIPMVKLPLDLQSFPPFFEYLKYGSIASLILILFFAINRMYSLKNHQKLGQELSKILANTTLWLFLIISYYFLSRSFPFSRLALLFTWLLTVIFIIIGRILLRLIKNWLFKKGIGQKKLVFIGENQITNLLFKNLSLNPEYNCIGFIDDQNQKISDFKYLGKISDLPSILKKYQIEEIIQTKTKMSESESNEIMDICREKHLNFSFVPELLEIQQTNVEVETIATIPVIKFKPTPLNGWSKVIKRIFDLFSALFGITVLSPILVICALLIKLDDPKSTIFFKYLDDGTRVKRVGEKGKLFHFYKFRTMLPNSHNLRYTELASKNIRGEKWSSKNPLVKIKDDPRCTKVGKFLRKYSLDELPQLFNVLKGEMSLVGPRPHLPEEVAKYQKHHKFVLTIKPGITGFAQINGRSDLDFEKEVKLDTYYIENWNIWLDLKILFKTLFVVFKKYEE